MILTVRIAATGLSSRLIMLIVRTVSQLMIVRSVRVVVFPALLALEVLVPVCVQGYADFPLSVRIQWRPGDPSVSPGTLRIRLIVMPRSLWTSSTFDLADATEAAREYRQDPSDEGEPYAHADTGRSPIYRVDTGLGYVEHGEIDDKGGESARRGEPREQSRKAEQRDVVDGIDQAEHDSGDARDEGCWSAM
jgi:hypothetical protein